MEILEGEVEMPMSLLVGQELKQLRKDAERDRKWLDAGGLDLAERLFQAAEADIRFINEELTSGRLETMRLFIEGGAAELRYLSAEQVPLF